MRFEDIHWALPKPRDEMRVQCDYADERRGAVLRSRTSDPRLRSKDERRPSRTVKTDRLAQSCGLPAQADLLTDNPDTRYLGLDAYDLSTGTRPKSTQSNAMASETHQPTTQIRDAC